MPSEIIQRIERATGFPGLTRISASRLSGSDLQSLLLKIFALRAGKLLPGDGGFTDWTQQYLGSKKERLLISAIGSELICQHFRKSQT